MSVYNAHSVHKQINRVLVVDDNPGIRDMMIDILDSEGYDADTARNGREALEKLQSEHHYLIFLDVMMPVMDGREFCHILNAHPAVRARHVIVLMSAADQLIDAHTLNVDEVMPKPFVVDDVINAIEPYI